MKYRNKIYKFIRDSKKPLHPSELVEKLGGVKMSFTKRLEISYAIRSLISEGKIGLGAKWNLYIPKQKDNWTWD